MITSPFQFGITDGLGQPFDLTIGRTWDGDDYDAAVPNTEHSDDPNEDYDLGVNVGQNLARMLLLMP